ncbi:MAG: phosphate ABC transporter substrate-binding protein [Gemmatimonadota bacterium]|nr:phosphate ABC transporter substrate-binding protein [Gemmatimonadota bacterium]
MMTRIIPFVVVIAVACGGGANAARTLIQNKGSDTLVNVAQAWAEAYGVLRPDVAIAVSGGGSGTGISAMINGTVDIANASRQMRESELEAARTNGNDPVEFVVGYDALAIFLHPDNPVTEMSIDQLAGIYGDGGTIETWSQLGVSVPGCASDEIIRVSRQNNSGTYAYFRASVLGDNDFKLGSRDMHGSKDVVDLVENTPCAIGYSGLAYATEHTSMPCLVSADGGCVAPTVATAIARTYPIARPLFMYTAGQPTGAIREYLDWVLSADGQCIILELGYAPATSAECA